MSAYSSAVLALSPTHYWRMNATSGTTETDLGSLGFNLTYNGGFTLGGPSLIGSDSAAKSVAFDGSTGYAATATAEFITSGILGYVAWFSNTNNNQNGFVFQYSGIGLAQQGPVSTGDQITVDGNLGFYQLSTPLFPSDGAPHMLALMLDLSTTAFTLMLDGSVIDTRTAAVSGASFVSVVAAFLSSLDHMAASIAEVATIPGLTPTQVTSLFTTATAAIPVTGTGASAQAAQTSSGSGTVLNPVSGTGASAQAAQTSNGVAKETISATGAAVQAAQTASGTGNETIGVTGTAVQSAQTVAATGHETLGSSGTSVQAAQTVAASGTESIGANGTSVQGAQTDAAAGTVTIPPITTTGAPVQSAQNVAATGAAGSPPVNTTGASVQAAQNVTATGTAGSAPITTTGTAVQGAQTAAASGTVTEPNVTSTGATIQATQSVSAGGVVDAVGHAAVAQAMQTVAAAGHVQNLIPPEIVIVNFTIETENTLVLPILQRNT